MGMADSGEKVEGQLRSGRWVEILKMTNERVGCVSLFKGCGCFYWSATVHCVKLFCL